MPSSVRPGPNRAQHEHMETPPREKRARAAFFREKDAKRAAKQQRKKEKLTEKISLGGAPEKDVAPAGCSKPDVEVGVVSRVDPAFARGREQRMPLRILPLLAGTAARDATVGLSSVAGRATMWQGRLGMHTASMGRARLSPTPGLTFGLIGEGTNGLGSISSEPGKGVCVHWFIVAGTSRSISATSAPISRLAYSVDLRD